MRRCDVSSGRSRRRRPTLVGGCRGGRATTGCRGTGIRCRPTWPRRSSLARRANVGSRNGTCRARSADSEVAGNEHRRAPTRPSGAPAHVDVLPARPRRPGRLVLHEEVPALSTTTSSAPGMSAARRSAYPSGCNRHGRPRPTASSSTNQDRRARNRSMLGPDRGYNGICIEVAGE